MQTWWLQQQSPRQVLWLTFTGNVLLALLGLALSNPVAVAVFYPANVWSTLILAGRPRREWPGVLLVSVLASVLARQGYNGHGLLTLSFQPGVLLEMVLGGLLLQRWLRQDHYTDSIMRALPTMLLAVVLPRLIGSLPVVWVLHAWWGQPYGSAWVNWLVGGTTGGLCALFMLIRIQALGPRAFLHQCLRGWQGAGILLALGLVTLIVWTADPFHFVPIATVSACATLFLGFDAATVLIFGTAMLMTVAYTRGFGLAGSHPLAASLTPELLLIEAMVLLPAMFIALERKRLVSQQRQASDSRDELAWLLDSMEEGVVVQDGAGRILRHNAQACQILGRRADQLTGRTWLDPAWQAVHVDGSPFAGEQHPAMRVLQTGEPQHKVVMGLQLPGGAQRWLQINALPLLRTDGTRQVLCTFSDVTGERDSLRALSSLEGRYRGLLENAPDAIITFDRQMRVTDLNRVASNLFGYPHEDFVRLSVSDLLPPEAVDRHAQVVGQFMQEQSGGRRVGGGRVLYGRHRDGHLLPLEIALARFTLSDGLHIMVIARDVSEQLKAREQLEELSQSVAQCPTGVVISDLEHRIQYVNQAYLNITGFPAEALIGQHFRILKSGLTPAASFLGLNEALARGEPWRGVMINRRPDGSQYDCQMLVAPIIGADGQVRKYLGMAEDVSEQRKVANELHVYREHLEDMVRLRTEELSVAKAAAEQASRTKSLFLANMSHEIRTPLNAVIGFNDLLRQSLHEPVQRERSERVDAAARHLLLVLNDLLDFSKIEAGKLELHEEPTELDQVLGYARDVCQSRLGNKSVQVQALRAPELPALVMMDRIRLIQILSNLASNAAKFTEQGEIVLSMTQVTGEDGSPQLHIEVRDSGIGISESQQQHLFQPFTQASSSITRQYGGTGLGLALCRSLCGMMGGHIRVDSALGQGSCFHVRLPFKPMANQSQAPVPQAAHSVPARMQGQVLVVDDQPFNQALISELLTDRGLSVTLADNGERALALCAGQTFDLILMDVQMPVMDGLQATRLLRQREATRETPIIAITANAFNEDRQDCLAAGMNDYLAKPLDLNTLLTVLARYLSAAPPEPAAPALADCGPLTRILQQMPDIDFERALAVVGGKASLLERVLTLFLEKYQPAVLPVEPEALPAFLHSLRSSAASLGATALAEAASRAEAACKVGQPVGLDQVQSLLQALVGQFGAGESAMPADAPALQQLRALLESSDTRAMGWLRSHQQAFGLPAPAQLSDLRQLVDNFAFEEALSLFETLYQQLVPSDAPA